MPKEFVKTTNKDLKRIIRARMKKTGESHTAARAQVVRKKQRPADRNTPVDYAQTAGMSDQAVEAKTGHTRPSGSTSSTASMPQPCPIATSPNTYVRTTRPPSGGVRP